MKLLPITVAMLTCNNERTIAKVLRPLTPFAEVLLLDTGSHDQTLALASAFDNVRIIKSSFTTFGALRNHLATLARHDWILTLDSDEEATTQLIAELQALNLDINCVYSFPFHNYYNGRLIKCCGWYPDRHIRLYNRTKTAFSLSHVHESLSLTALHESKLQGPIKHYSYTCIADFLHKMQRYSDLFAKQYQGKRKSSTSKAIRHGLFAFIKNYFLQKGWFYGYEGFLIASYNAHTAFYKYLKLAEANHNLKSSLSTPSEHDD